MNKVESAKITAVIEKAYQRFYTNYTENDKLLMIELWASIFREDEYAEVSTALRAYIAGDTKGFPPVPGQIRELMTKTTCSEGILPEMDAWAAVRKAIRNANYHAAEEFELLPELVKKVVVSPSNLTEWARLDSEEVSTVIQSNFTRSYRAAVERQKELARMPQDIRRLMQGEKLQITENTQKEG